MGTSTIELFHPVSIPEMESAALEVLRSGQIASGPSVIELETAFTNITGRKNIVSTNDLTSAVAMALHLAGVEEGDRVATLAFSCLQSNSPIAHLRATPVWIDIDPTTMSMSVEDLSSKLTPAVKAVLVYHVAGYPANTERIAALCRSRGVPLIEDCNNAIGATCKGRPVGVDGDFAVYSLYPTRQINGIDGGMLATPDTATAARAKRLRRYGIDTQTFRDGRGEINPEADVSEIGWSAALNNLNAAVALAQLRTLKERVERTRSIANRIVEGLRGMHHLYPVQPISGATPAFWGLLVRSPQRDALLEYLKTHGIKCSILHQRNDWYSGFGTRRANLPGTDIIMNQILALPCGWWMTDTQIDDLLLTVSNFN